MEGRINSGEERSRLGEMQRPMGREGRGGKEGRDRVTGKEGIYLVVGGDPLWWS